MIFKDAIPKNFNHSDNVAIYPDLHLIYNRIKKSGNTTITAFLSEISGKSYENSAQLKKGILSPLEASFFEIVRAREYYLFTFVRNPYSRVLSAYLDKIARGQGGRFSRFPGYGKNSPEGFEEFVVFLSCGGLLANRHWWPQVELLSWPLSRFDYIGRVEQMDEGMARVLKDVGSDFSKASSLRVPHVLSAHTTSAASKEDYYYSSLSRKLVRELYGDDFEAFGY